MRVFNPTSMLTCQETLYNFMILFPAPPTYERGF